MILNANNIRSIAIHSIFQGFIIFLIFILKPKILKAVRARMCVCCCGPPEHSKTRGTFNFTSFMLSDNTTSVSEDFGSERSRNFTAANCKHDRASPACSSSSSLSGHSITWRQLESRASFMARCMSPSFLANKTTNNNMSKQEGEPNFGSTSTTLSSTRSSNPSSGSSSPPLTLSATFLNSQFTNAHKDNSPYGGEFQVEATEGVVAFTTPSTSIEDRYGASCHSLPDTKHNTRAILPVPRQRAAFIKEETRSQLPDLPPRPSLLESIKDTRTRSLSHPSNIADIQV